MVMVKSKVHFYDSNHYPPVRFLNIEIGKARACMGIGGKRYIIDGKMTLNYVDSEKWGREVHIQVFSKNCRVEERSGEREWIRMEIFFPFESLDELIMQLQNLRINFSCVRPEGWGMPPIPGGRKPGGKGKEAYP